MLKKNSYNDGLYAYTNPNFLILVKADSLGWRVARKVKGMIAFKLPTDTPVHSIEGVVHGKAGMYACRGVDTDDWWVQKEETVLKKYELRGAYEKPVKFEGKTVLCQLFEPKPDREVLACGMTVPFEVKALWGDLKGKPNDYLVKPKEDMLNANPEDVWLVDQRLFKATYKF